MSRKIRVLLVDDDVDYARMTQLSLEKTDKFDVTIVPDARSGLEETKKNPPEIILLDLLMPERSGGWYYNKIKQDEELSKIPVITVSALIDKPDHDGVPERDRAGMISLWKPLNPELLIEAILNEVS